MHGRIAQSDKVWTSRTSFGPTDPMMRPASTTPRVVLLPPQSRGASKADRELAEALVSDITDGLTVLHNLSVIAPHTASNLRQNPGWRDEIDRHKIDYVLDTTITPDGLLLFLVALPADVVVWFHREKLDTAALAHQRLNFAWAVTSQIAQEMENNRVFHSDYIRNPKAYRLYLTGVHRLRRHTITNMQWARAAFEEALDEASDFAPALSGLSRTFTMEWHLRGGGNFELMRAAEETACKAIELNPLSPFGHCEYGIARLYANDIDQSLDSLTTAARLGPHYADALCYLGDTLVHDGKPEEGLALIQDAMNLNFMPPDIYFLWAASACFFLGEYQDSLDYIARMKAPAAASRSAALNWAMLGNLEQAEIERRRFFELNPTFNSAEWLARIPFRDKNQGDLYRHAFRTAGY